MRIFFLCLPPEFSGIMGSLLYILPGFVFIILIWLIILYRSVAKLKRQHRAEMEQMQIAIVALTRQNGLQLDHLKLSDNLMVRLRQAREKLDRELIGLQKDYAQAVSDGLGS